MRDVLSRLWGLYANSAQLTRRRDRKNHCPNKGNATQLTRAEQNVVDQRSTTSKPNTRHLARHSHPSLSAVRGLIIHKSNELDSLAEGIMPSIRAEAPSCCMRHMLRLLAPTGPSLVELPVGLHDELRLLHEKLRLENCQRTFGGAAA